LMDVASYNYQEQWYQQDKAAYPDRIIVGTESFPYFRGRTDMKETAKLNNPYCDFTERNPWYDVANNDYVIGQFIWSGIDYLGESAGWPSKGWCNGIIDTCGFIKARAGFHTCAWNPTPSVHIGVLSDTLDIDHGQLWWSWPEMAHHWNFPNHANRLLRVETVTNCESVELLLNGESLGTRDTAGYANGSILWYVPYVAGSLKAIAKINDQVVSVDEIITAGKPAALSVKNDRVVIKSDAQDVFHLIIDIVDENQVLVPDCDLPVTVEIDGPGLVIGMDNGDLRCPEPYKTNTHTTHWGRCLAIVQSTLKQGIIRAIVKAEGLPEVVVEVSSQP